MESFSTKAPSRACPALGETPLGYALVQSR